jgi:hypothetical protein
MIGEHKKEGILRASGGEEPMWLMLANEVCSIASPAVKKDIMPKTALNVREEEKWELKLTSLTLTQKKARYTKEVKPKAVEWP